jgi:hypothetical protein
VPWEILEKYRNDILLSSLFPSHGLDAARQSPSVENDRLPRSLAEGLSLLYNDQQRNCLTPVAHIAGQPFFWPAVLL